VTLFAVAILVILGIGYLAVPDFARHLFPHKQSHATSQVDVAGGLVRAA
jgi:hypothetical protein